MRIGRNEIIEELTEHIRQCGGDMEEWCVGTAGTIETADSKLKIQDEPEDTISKLAYREAHTPYAAADAVDYLVGAFGLRPAPCSTAGKIVFVYHAAREAAAARAL